jgi:hypothetical protein
MSKSKLDQLRALGPSQIGRRAAKAAAKSKLESVSKRQPAKSKPRKPRSKKARTKPKVKAETKPKRGRPFSNFSKTDYQREYMRNKRVRKALGFVFTAGQKIDRDELHDQSRWIKVRGNRVFGAWKDTLKSMTKLYPDSFDIPAKRLAKTVYRT